MSTDTLTNKLATKAETGTSPAKDFTKLLEQMKPQIAAALPKHVTPDRISRIALTAYRNNEKLRQCSSMSILASVMVASQLGLEINTPLGQAYIIPYQNKGQMEAQFQLGYMGLIELAYRTGEYQVITAMEVYANDELHYEYGLNMDLRHKPADVPQGQAVAYYALYKTKSGGMDFRVWSRAKVEAHAKKYSQAYQKGWSSPWKSDFDAMAKKTVLKDVLKYAPRSIELQRQLSNDETIKHDIASDMTEVQPEYIDVEFSREEAEGGTDE